MQIELFYLSDKSLKYPLIYTHYSNKYTFPKHCAIYDTMNNLWHNFVSITQPVSRLAQKPIAVASFYQTFHMVQFLR